MKLYTKGGDKGATSLVGGERVAKDDIRVEAYGTVDELSAFVALLGDKLVDGEGTFSEYIADIHKINSTLMTIEAHLASDGSITDKLPAVTDEAVQYIESRIDELQSQLPPLDKFTIPGGEERVSLCHVCRTVCRRAERRSITAAREFDITPNAVIYLNRLSDYLYALGRVVSVRLGVEEILWR